MRHAQSLTLYNINKSVALLSEDEEAMEELTPGP